MTASGAAVGEGEGEKDCSLACLGRAASASVASPSPQAWLDGLRAATRGA